MAKLTPPAQVDDWVLEFTEPVRSEPRGRNLMPMADDWQLGPVVNPSAAASQNPWERFVQFPFMRGLNSLGRVVDTAQLITGGMAPQTFLDNEERRTWELEALPLHPDDLAFQEQFKDAEGWDAVGMVMTRPQLWAQTMVQSLPMSAAPAIGALGGAAMGAPTGPVGAAAGGMAGAYTASFMQEFNASIMSSLEEQGVDLSTMDSETLGSAILDPKIMGRAKDYAVKRGIPIAAFDALSMGLAGRAFDVIAPVAGPVVGKVLGGAAETAVQGGLGAAGEAGAQLISEGRITNAGDIALEAFAEVPGAVIEPAVKAAVSPLVRKPKPDPVDAMPENPAPFATQPVDNPNVQQANPQDWVLEPPGLSTTGAPGEVGNAPAPEPVAQPGSDKAQGTATAPATPVQASPVDPVQVDPQFKGYGTAPPRPQQAPEPANQNVQPQPQAPANTGPTPVAPVQNGSDANPRIERVVTPDGAFETDTEFEVVDADQLRAAEGDLQPRDRLNRGESGNQIRDIAARLDPLRLGSSRESDRGAPIIDEGNTILSGNGRVQSIMLAAQDHPERYEAYRQHLASQGYNVDGVKTPVLVRRARNVSPEDKARFAGRSNINAGQEMSAPELARMEAGYITPTMLQSFNTDVEEGVTAAANHEFRRQFVASMPQSQRNAVLTADGQISEQGAKRIANAIFARAYGDRRLIDRATETNADPAIRNALLGAAPSWAGMKDVSPDFDITPDLIEALGVINDAKAKGFNVANYLSQLDAFRQLSPRAEKLLRLFQNKGMTRLAAWADIRDRLKDYAQAGANAAQASGDLMGDRPGPDAVLDGIIRAIEKKDDPGPAAPGAKAPAAQGGELFPTGQVLSLPPKNGRRKAAKVTAGTEGGALLDADQDADESIYAYRGEHGADAPKRGFHTRLPSISFGSKEAATIYANEPNDRRDIRAANPRVRRFRLRIDNPIIDNVDDPFIDVSTLIEALGREVAERLALRHADYITNTGNWDENFRDFDSVADVIENAPERLGELYLESYPILDDPDFVTAAREAGYDGAITSGTGENAGEPEYRIFEGDQAIEVDEDGNPVPETMDDERRLTGPLAPQTQDVSFSKGLSKYEGAWRIAGLTPDEGVLLTPVEKRNVLAKVFKNLFGFKRVDLNEGTRLRISTVDGVNQMLDAVQNVHFMASVLGLPLEAIGLDGTLTISLEQDRSYYLGQYRPMDATIALPGRTNSFAHEWAHALDHWLGKTVKNGKNLLSRIARGQGLDPTQSLENAYINLIHSLFFEDGAVALAALDLERKAAEVIKNGPDAGKPTKAALAAQAQHARLLAGATRMNLPASKFRDNSIKFQPNTDYWASVHEMIARSFEAYVAWKVEAAGGTNNFITKGDSAYRSDADRRLAMTFPKDGDRMVIFSAWDDVMHHVRTSTILGVDPGAPLPANADLADPNRWAKMSVAAETGPAKSVQDELVEYGNRLKNLITNPVQATKDAGGSFREGLGVSANMPARRVVANLADKGRFFFYNVRGLVNPIIKRNRDGSAALKLMWDRFATQHGTGQESTATYEEEVDRGPLGVQKIAGRIESLFRANGRRNVRLNEADNDTVRELLYGAKIGADAQLKAIAAELRRIMDQAHVHAKDAGIKLGYVEDKGYLPRVINTRKVQQNLSAFVQDAVKVYLKVYDRVTAKISPEDMLGLARQVRGRMDPLAQRGAGLAGQEIEALVQAQRKLRAAKAALASEREAAAAAKRPVDPKFKQAVIDAEADLDAALDTLRDAIREPYADMSAQAYSERIALGETVSFDHIGPAADWTKARALPGEADAILKDWYDTDVLNLVLTYTHSVAKRAAYVKRAGNTSGNDQLSAVLRRPDVQNRVAMNPAKYDPDTLDGKVAIIRDLANPASDNLLKLAMRAAVQHGANGEDVAKVEDAIAMTVGGNYNRGFRTVLDAIAGKVYFLTYIMLLGRAAITSITEPATMILRTGSVRAGLVTFVHYLGDAVLYTSKSAKDRRELARVIGMTTSQIYDSVLLNKLGADFGHIHSANHTLARYFRMNGLAPLTNHQRRVVMAGGTFWMRGMARQFLGSKIDKAERARIENEFRDVGIPTESVRAFSEWLVSLDGLPGVADLDSKAGQLWTYAIGRFADQTIQNPRKADKPYLSSDPTGRVAYALTSFLYSFYQNVHVAHWNRVKRDYASGVDAGLNPISSGVRAGGAAIKSLGLGFGAMFAANVITTIARESMFNQDAWEKHRKEGDLEEWVLALAMSRTGLLGPFDMIGNMLTGLRYDRDLTGMFTGAGVSYIMSNIQNILTGFGLGGRNSPNNNTAERNAAKGAYRLLVAPVLTWAMSALDVAGPIGGAARWGALVKVNSNDAAEDFADMLVGKPNSKAAK